MLDVRASGYLSLVLSTGLYTASFRQGVLLAVSGDSGHPIYDFFMGRKLNPCWGSFVFGFSFDLQCIERVLPPCAGLELGDAVKIRPSWSNCLAAF